MLFILLAGPTAFLLRNFVTVIGDYGSSILRLSFQLYPYQGVSKWLQSWTLTYFFWWIAWAPFVGVFIARISRGRTIREFVIGVLFAPTIFSLFWFAIFGGADRSEAGGMVQVVREDVRTASKLPESIRAAPKPPSVMPQASFRPTVGFREP